MTSALYDSIARIARHEASARAIAGVGKVTDVFTKSGASADYAVTVQMRDSGLVLPRVPIAASPLGLVALPAVDDLVVVVFMDGDYNAPVVVGRLYRPDQNPPEHQEGQMVLALPSGEAEPKLKLVVVGADPSIKLAYPDSEVAIEVTEGKVKIAVGEIQISVEDSGGGRAEIAAGGSKITLKKDGDITVSSQGKLKLEGTEVEISGSSKVKVSGAMVEIN